MENVQDRVDHETARVLDDVTQKIKDSPALKQWVMSEQGKESVREWKAEQRRITAVNAADLVNMDIPPIEWIVKDLLPVGLGILGAPPKSFKSFMVLQMCLAICRGEKFLCFETVKNSCLYCDLESNKRRPKARLQRVLNKRTPPDNFYFITADDNPGTLGHGFEDTLIDQIKQHPDIKLIVVDVFQKIRGDGKAGENLYNRDYKDLGALKQISDQYNVAILIVHHFRKSDGTRLSRIVKDGGDPFELLSGSTAMFGSVDAGLLIVRDGREGTEASFCIDGRDIESAHYKIQFDKKSLTWGFLGDAEALQIQRDFQEYNESNITKVIRKLLKMNNGSWEGSAEDIKQASRYWREIGEIYDDSRIVGRFISDHASYFSNVDGITVDYGRTNKSRFYRFHDTYVTNDTNVSNDTDVTEQVEIEGMFK